MKFKYSMRAIVLPMLMLTGIANGQIYPGTNEDGKFGYINEKGDTIMAFNLDEAYHLKNGVAKFKKDGKCGFINADGKIIAEPKYAETGTFNSMGVCWVCMKGETDKNGVFSGSSFGLINKEGKEIIPPVYEEVGSFSVVIKEDKYYMYDEKDDADVLYPNIDATAEQSQEKTNWMRIASSELPLSPFFYFWYTNDKSDRRVGVVDMEGNKLFGEEMHYTVFPPSNGMILLRVKKGKNMKVAYFDMDTKQLCEVPFENGVYRPFRCGVARVEPEKGNGYCFINKQMKQITPIFKNVGEFKEGVCPVLESTSGLCGMIDSTGQNVVPYIYKSIGNTLCEGLIYISDTDDKMGYIDSKGNIIIPLEYEQATNFRCGLAGVKKDGKWGYGNRMNETVVPLIWENLILPDYQNQPLVWVKEQEKWYGYSTVKKQIVTENGYKDIMVYKNRNFHIVRNEEKYGIINSSGQEAIPVALNSFEDAKTAVKYLEENNKQQLTGIELRRYLLQMPNTSANSYKLKDKIPDELWDY